MSNDLMRPEMFPYAVAAGVLVGLVVIEAVGLLAGVGPLSSLGHALGAHAHGPHGHGGHAGTAHAPGRSAGRPGLALLGWLNIGGAPFAVVLLSLLATFALSGTAIVALCAGAGVSCAPLVSMPAAAVAAAIATRSVTRIVGRLIPQDESYAIGPDALLGALAVVTVGPVRHGHRGRGKTRDQYGNWHFPLIEVADEAATFGTGETVMLVAHRSGAFLVTAPDPRLMPKPSPDRLDL